MSLLISVVLLSLLTALATGLGAVPFYFIRQPRRYWIGIANAFAAGLMLSASFGLIYEGLKGGLWRLLLGILLGLGFIWLSNRFLQGKEGLHMGELGGMDARKAILLVAIMTVHSFAEGVGVGVAFGGGEKLGVFISIAIAIHNIPEGLAISLVLVPKGVSPTKAAGWSILSSMPQPLMAIPAFLFVEKFKYFLPVGLGFAAGAMLWMVIAELLPDALEETSPDETATAVTIAIVMMILFQELARF